ncbi:Dps family protein [Bacillus songklensis]|uniref:Dps family protein n=1 Tax=Bacillus songklensis TaxID=1069116 RepID=A0ABV8B9K3_9BACI
MNLEQAMNQQIANWNVLYTKLHRFHWYVKGPLFFTLHAKFEELYNEAAVTIDVLAERLLSIGGKPIATMKQYLENASIEETNHEATAEEMVQALINDYALLRDELKNAVKAAEHADDEATADMFVELTQKVEIHLWMLRAFLNN